MKFLTFLILITFTLTVTVYSQTKRRVVNKPKSKPVVKVSSENPEKSTTTNVQSKLKNELLTIKPRFSEKRFQPEDNLWESIPKEYLGHDFTKLYTDMVSVFKPKDEFETTLAYQDRFAKGADGILVGDITPKSTLAFRFDPEITDNKFSVKYDADTENFTVNIDLEYISSFSENYSKLDSSKGIRVLKSEAQSLSTYEGQNAYGAKKTITKADFVESLVAFNNLRDFKSYFSSKNYSNDSTLQIQIKMPADKARLAKPNFSYLVIAQPMTPFIGTYIETVKPKIDQPVDITTVKKYITANVLEIWLFNRETGEIYQKLIAKPITSGNLKIASDIKNEGIILLRKSLVDILEEAGLQPIDKTNSGKRYDLVATFLKSSKDRNHRTANYTTFFNEATAVIQKNTIQTINADYLGNASVENLPFGKYYLFSFWGDSSGVYVWDKEIEINDEEIKVNLHKNNADYK